MRSGLKDIPGKKIRRQYFNKFLIAIFSFMLLFTYVYYIFEVALGKFNPSMVPSNFKTIFIIGVCLIFPFLILWVLNKYFFGKIICILTKEGIFYSKKMIHWDKLKKVEFSFSSTPTNVTLYTQYGTHIVLNKAPLYLLSSIRKYNKSIEIKISGISFLLSTILIFVAIGTIIPIYILLINKSPGFKSLSSMKTFLIVFITIEFVLMLISSYIFDKYLVKYYFWRRILPNKVLSYIILIFYHSSFFWVSLTLFYFPNWITVILLGIYMGVVYPPMLSKIGNHRTFNSYKDLYDIYINHADFWEKKIKNKRTKNN